MIFFKRAVTLTFTDNECNEFTGTNVMFLECRIYCYCHMLLSLYS